MLKYIASTQGLDKSPFQEDKLRLLNGISSDQVREILATSRRRAAAGRTPAPATPAAATTASTPSLAAAQPPTPAPAQPARRGYATGKAIAKSAASHLAAEWVCVYDDLFSTDPAWPDSKACYDYFSSL